MRRKRLAAILPITSASLLGASFLAAEGAKLAFPGKFETFESNSYIGTQVFLPDGENWFQLDGTKCTERFCLLASTQRLKTLEGLSLTYRDVKVNPRSTISAKNAARQAVLDEIARVRKQHSQLTIAAEEPVTIAGGTRGINTSVAKLATRIEATESYTKTFRLDH